MLRLLREKKSITAVVKYLRHPISAGFIHDKDGIDEEKLKWVMELKNVRRGRISEYADKFSGAEYHAGKRPWVAKGSSDAMCDPK